MGSDADTESQGIRRFVPDLIRRHYAAKLGVAFLVVILLISAVGGVIYLESRAAIARDTDHQLERSAISSAETLNEWIGRMRDEARLLSRSQPLKADDPAETSRFLTREVTETGRLPSEVIALHVVNTTRFEIVASSNPNFIGLNPRKKGVSWAQQQPSFESPDDTTVTPPFMGPKVNKPVFAILSPVPGKHRILVFMVDLEERVKTLPKPADGFVQVVNAEGTVVMSHHTDRILSQNMGDAGVDSPAVTKGLNGQHGTISMEMNGTSMVMGYAPIEGTDWVAMSHVPKQSAFALQRSISRNLLILVLISLLGLGAIGLTIGRNTIRSLNTLTAKAETIESGDLDVDLRIRRVDEIGRLYAAFDGMRNSLRDTIREAEQARQEAEREREESEQLLEHLETKADAYSARMEKAANGDLSVRLDPESENAAMTQIAKSFNEMVAELERTLVEIQQFADRVASASEDVTISTDEIQNASAQVSESVQEISAGTERAQDQLQDVSREIQSLSGTIEEVAASADQVAATAQQAAELGATGQNAASDAIDEMAAIETTTEKTAEEVEHLATEIGEVSEIVDLIADIAEQTNLLALNASIEAARAGEAGEGFAVVADEVKGLAEEASEATEQIEERIDRIQQSATEAVEEMQETSDRVASGSETIEDALTALEDVAEQVEDTNHGIQEISEATDEQAESTTEVVNLIDEVATLAEQNSAEAGNVSAAAEEQTASLTEVADNTESLLEQANELQERLDMFMMGDVNDTESNPQIDAGSQSGTVADGGNPDQA